MSEEIYTVPCVGGCADGHKLQFTGPKSELPNTVNIDVPTFGGGRRQDTYVLQTICTNSKEFCIYAVNTRALNDVVQHLLDNYGGSF